MDNNHAALTVRKNSNLQTSNRVQSRFSCNTRRELYRPTKGWKQDASAPLERVLTGGTSSQVEPLIRSSKETLESEDDLGTLEFSGVPAHGKRQTFQDATGQRTRTQDTWFAPTLGLTVHMESRNSHDDSSVSDLFELHLGDPAPASAEKDPSAAPEVSLLHLYRSFFRLVAHMERDRLANDPNLHVNMNDIEEHLRNKIVLSPKEWRSLIAKSVYVDGEIREAVEQARSVTETNRSSRHANQVSANVPVRATLHKMQQNLNAQVQKEIDDLNASMGADATRHIEAYLKGTMTSTMSVTRLSHAQAQALRSQTGGGQ